MNNTNSLTEHQKNLIKFAKAIGNPARLRILIFLSQQETCYFGKIHNELPIAKATVSQHLTQLKAAGLIQGEIKGTKVNYCINRENWQIAKDSFNEFFSALKII